MIAKRTAILLAASAVLTLAASAARAQDASRDYDWSGFYFGVSGGFGWGYAQAFNIGTDPGTGDGPGGFDDGTDWTLVRMVPYGAVGGFNIGYNRQNGRFVTGFDAEIGYLHMGQHYYDNSGPDGANGLPDDDTGFVQYGWYGNVTYRIGYALTPRLLIVGRVGAIVAQYDSYYADLDGGAIDPSDLAVLANPQFGVTVGAGFEYAINERLSVRAEYSYFHLGNDIITNDDGDLFKTHNTGHQIRIGLNYRFGG